MSSTQEYRYFAFISYKREDEKWAKWLQHKLEHYKLPTNIEGRTDLPKEIRPVFRDKTELNPTNLSEQIRDALEQSRFLVVICSPRSANSEWVNLELDTFIKMNGIGRVIPFIIEGSSSSEYTNVKCYPRALRELPQEKEILGAHINEVGRDAAAVMVVAQMFGLHFDTLWQRYKREQKVNKTIKTIIGLSFVLLTVALLFSGIRYYDKKVVEFCKIGIKADDGLYTIQQKLFDYQKKAWLLKKDTRSILKHTIYEIDYSYNILPFPVIYSFQLKGDGVDCIRFRHDESQIAIAGIREVSGVLDYKNNSFKSFDGFASSIDYIHNSDTIIACGEKVYLYNENVRKIADYNVDGYGVVASPTSNQFTCKSMKKLTTYNMQNGDIVASKNFDKDILCYAYNKSGEYIAAATTDSLLTLICAETGDIIFQRKDSLPIADIAPSNDDFSFYVAFYGDSTRVTKVSVNSNDQDTLLFSIPTYHFRKNRLSYTMGEYLAFTNGRYFMLYNTCTNESFPWDVYNAFKAEMDAVDLSSSGTKVCYSINGKIYVMQIKNKEKKQRFPIQQYGFSNVTGPSVAGIYPDDSTVVMAVINNKGLTSVGLYNLYSGEPLYETFETTAPVWKVIPLPTPYHAVVALDETNSWAVIDFLTGEVVKKLAVDTLTCASTLMLTANRKYLLGIYKGTDIFGYNDCRCVWSSITYNRLDSTYFYSGPLQDGEHLYNDYAFYSYPERKELFQSYDYSFSENGEFFDRDEMAYMEGKFLSVFNMKKGGKHSINMKPFVQGDIKNYRVVGYKNNFAILFNNQHLMVFDTKNDDLVLQKVTTPYECITSASFFNNESRVLVTTNTALYIFDVFGFEQLCAVWRERLQ